VCVSFFSFLFSFLFSMPIFEQESLGYLYDTPDWIT
jgi:hypothetical protein